MRVICIDDKDFKLNITGENAFCPLIQGKIYDVELCSLHKNSGYILQIPLPYAPHNCECISSERFELLSEIDERELSHAEPIESTFILKEV